MTRMTRTLLPALVCCLICAAAAAQIDRFERVAAREAGFSASGLAELEGYLEEAGSSALILVHDGREERATRSFFHTGAGVHMLGVYPGARLVMVHRVDTENGSAFTQDRLYRVISLVFAAVR